MKNPALTRGIKTVTVTVKRMIKNINRIIGLRNIIYTN